MISVFYLSDPSNSNVIRANNTGDSTDFSGLHSLFGDDGVVLEEIWKDTMKITDVETQEERFSLLSNNLKKLDQLRRKWDEEERAQKRNQEERIRKQQEKFNRDMQRRRELEHRERLKNNEKSWYQTLFDVTLPGQIYSLYSYLKSFK